VIARRAIAIAALWVLASCGSDDAPSWSDAADDAWLPVRSPTTVAEGDQWRMDVGTEPGADIEAAVDESSPDDDAQPAGQCLQLVVAGQPLGCIRLNAGSGQEYGFGVAVRAGTERVIWRASTMTDEEPPVGHFVVWSSASPNGRRVDPIRYGDVESLLWIMEPGEAPWGYQTIGPDGTLVDSWSYVGLPAD
jgi:hypothetical protein